MKATQKQIEYAKDISDALGVDLPKEDSREAYSEFLDMYVGEYKELIQSMKLDHEAKMEAIDARRDW